MDLTAIEGLRAFAKMINTLDVSKIEPLLSEDFHYASQQVLAEITSKKEYIDYITKKLETISQSGFKTYAEMAELLPIYFGGGPCVVLAQGGKDHLVCTVLIEVEDGYIKRLDSCIVPPPEAAKRTGEYPV